MRKGIVTLLVLMVVLSAVVFAVGCGSSSTTSTQDAKTQMQDDMNSLKSSLAAFTDTATYTSKQSIENAAKDVQKAFDQVVKSAKNVANVSTQDLQDAWKQFTKALDELTGSDKPLTESVQDIKAATQGLQSAWEQTYNNLTK